MPVPESSKEYPRFSSALWVWVKIGLLSFGGPAGQIALMNRELVERRRWISDRRFLHALNYCMLLPGPEAQQLAIYTGWLLHRVRGGLVAGVLFVLPGAALMLGISVVYVLYGDVPLLAAFFDGLKPAVLAIVVAALLRIGRKALGHPLLWFLSACAFTAIFFFKVPFPMIVLGAGVVGLIGGRLLPECFSSNPESQGGKEGGAEGEDFAISDETDTCLPTLSAWKTLGTGLLWGAIWLLPVVVCLILLGRGNVFSETGIFFSKAAVVTFGGAYAVLPYVAQQAVETHGWLSASQMMDGLALAETTPGPLILVLQFVGFLGGWNESGGLSPLLVACLAAAIASWVTFMPGFLFIFAGAPYIERSRGNKLLHSALTGVTAAITGVMLNLAVWFGIHALRPEDAGFDFLTAAMAVVFFLLLKWRNWDVLWIVLLGGGLGVGSCVLGVG